MYTAAPIVAQHYPPFSQFSVESFHFINHNSPPSHFRPTSERRIAPVSLWPPRRLSDHLHHSDADRKRRKTFSKGDKTRKIAHLHPLEPVASGWTWNQRVKRGRTPPTISPSAPPTQNNAGACHKPSWLMRGSERAGDGQKVCVVGHVSDLVGGKRSPTTPI